MDDIIGLQAIGKVTVSPNGEWLAVLIKRSGGPLDPWNADVWLIPRAGGPARNLTDHLGPALQWSSLTWSPDGTRLAFVGNTSDERHINPYMWEAVTNKLTRLSDRDIDMHTAFDRMWPKQPLLWLDNVTLLCPVWQRGKQPYSLWGSDTYTMRTAPEQWQRMQKGDTATASVFETGQATSTSVRPQGELLRINVTTGATSAMASGYFWQIIVDPTNQYAALVADDGRSAPSEGKQLYYVHHFFSSVRHTRLGLIRLNGSSPVQWIDSIYDPAITAAEAVPQSWSPDGKTLAIVGKTDRMQPYASTVFLVSTIDATVRQLSDRTLEVSATTWAGDGNLLAKARRTQFFSPRADSTREDWWLFSTKHAGSTGQLSSITSDMSEPPTELIATSDTNRLLGISSGRLASIAIDGGRASGAAQWLSPDSIHFDQILWPDVTARAEARRSAVLHTSAGDLYRVSTTFDPNDRVNLTKLPRPSAEAELVATNPDRGVVVYTSTERTGTFLWVGDESTNRFVQRLALNTYLKDIADPERRLIDYRSADGEPLKALLVLPVGYVPGRRYPLITCVYGGDMITDTTEAFEKQSVSALNLSLFPAHGFALLIPSIPLGTEGQPSDPMIDIPKGVLPAVDEAIRQGIADSTRIGVIGISYGGYSTYSLITYSQRFRAAVALAGPVDLASMYGEMEAPARYADFGYEMQHMPNLLEAGMGRMGTSPWGNLWRYWRNSPYYLADRVQTPVMIVQGDMDYVSIQQGEEFFQAMFRLGKPATFVRYWGEGHVIHQSPANVRDMWRRVFEWFAKYLNDQHSDAVVGQGEP